MAKKTVTTKKHEIEDDFDLSELVGSTYDEEEMADFMTDLIESTNHHLVLAMELTKIAVGKNSGEMKAEDVLALYKRASHVVSDSFAEVVGKFNPMLSD